MKVWKKEREGRRERERGKEEKREQKLRWKGGK